MSSLIVKDFFNATKIVQKLSPRVRIFFGCYTLSIISYNFYAGYNDGRNALLDHRKNKLNKNFEKSETEFEVVKKEITRNSFDRLWNSIFFPFTVINQVTPSLVIYLNKKTDDEPPCI